MKTSTTTERQSDSAEAPSINRVLRVLLAEDNDADAYLIRQSLASLPVDILLRNDGEQMMQTLDSIEAGALPFPDLILLDLNLPCYNGIEVLERLRAGAVCSTIPVIVVTSSDAPRDRDLTAHAQVRGYFRKPSDYDEFMRLGDLVRQVVDQEAPGASLRDPD